MAITVEAQEILLTSYMHLFDAMVAKYQANGAILGQAQHDAIKEMTELMDNKYLDKIQTPAGGYVIHLFLSHKRTVARKSVESEHKEDRNPTDAARANEAVDTALKDLENKISTVNADPKAVQSTDSSVKTITPISSHCPTFQQWLRLRATPTDIARLGRDPAALADIYRKYMLRQKGS